ncbi:hypothetical protein [Jiulongibacter sediminis]|uniref:Uncharacterized protein n=1 Tax=Jiulongibacter sediminis TaxID=1605367 RepID=A0A0P7C598_9BACT|nr:hypothetical protein [Jiulongibacter sediminis]KPM49951.1 hypothetical protein AFM12_05130 [Jiulongibacter sediminis]TBX26984.1 hypothetical protein TK44_05135 [Jiulongibacter sediminis]
MLKIYFDTNIYSSLSKNEDKELNNFLKNKSENEFLFLYSQAHLNDLNSDLTDNKFKELRTIGELASTNFLHFDYKEKRVTNSIAEVEEVFQYMSNSDEGIKNIFDDLFKKTGDPIWDTWINLFKDQNIDLGPHIEEIMSRPDSDLEKAQLKSFGLTQRYYTIDELLKYLAKITDDFENKPELLRSIRLESMKQLEVNKLNIKINEVDFDKKLVESKLGKTYAQLISEQLENMPKDQKGFFTEFTLGYNLINFYGLDYEKNRKVKFKNTQNDGQHAFFGGMADIIVSQDKGLLNKCRFLYNYYGVDTKIISLEQFKIFIKDYRTNNYTLESVFISDLFSRRRRSIILNGKRPMLRHNQSEEIMIIDWSYWGFFNRLSEVKSYDNDDEYIILYKQNYRTGDTTFYKELKFIIESMNLMLKADFNTLSQEEIKLIEENNWKGFWWHTDVTDYWLRFNKETKRFGLQIGPLNNKAPD